MAQPKELLETDEITIEHGDHAISLLEASAQEDSQDTKTPAGRTRRRVSCTLIAVGPGNTADKCFYTQEAINSGPAFFENARCFENHINKLDKQIQPERKVGELVGFFTDVKVDGEKLVGVLNVFDGESFDKIWETIKNAINFAKANPGKNILGLSIHAAGDVKPITYNGEQWKAVYRFADVRSCDIVTWPARNGEFTAVLSESEKQPQSDDPKASDIFKTLKSHVMGLVNAGAPGAEETRRIVDQLGTSLKLNKQEAVMDPVSQMPATDPTANVTDEALASEARAIGHKTMAETYRRQAETESEEGKKVHAMGMAARHTKMAEALVSAPGAAVHVKPAAPGAPAAGAESEEAKKVREAEEARRASAPSSESENFEDKYRNLLVNGLLDKSGLPESKKEYLRTVVLEGEKNEEKIRTKVASYIRVELQEANRGGGHGAPRFTPPSSEGKSELKSTRPGLKKLLAVKGV